VELPVAGSNRKRYRENVEGGLCSNNARWADAAHMSDGSSGMSVPIEFAASLDFAVNFPSERLDKVTRRCILLSLRLCEEFSIRPSDRGGGAAGKAHSPASVGMK